MDVVTDNDGKVAALKINTKTTRAEDIFIRYDADEKYPTLRTSNMIKSNSLKTLNKILQKEFETDAELMSYMTASNNKTDVALAIFETGEHVKFPGYINDAVE